MSRMLGSLSLMCLVAVASAALPADVHAGVVRLDGVADGDSIYIEQPSDAFFRMDLFDPPPRQTQQRFHSISNPSVTFGNLAFDGFPNDADFRLGTITYDESSLVGGSGVATITNLTLGIAADPTNPAHVNYGRWTAVQTLVSNVVGTVTVVDGQPTGIDLTSDLTLRIQPFPPAEIYYVATGTFSIEGNRFSGYAATASTGPNTQTIYDFGGTLSTVPEPATFALAGLGSLLLLRRRTPARGE